MPEENKGKTTEQEGEQEKKEGKQKPPKSPKEEEPKKPTKEAKIYKEPLASKEERVKKVIPAETVTDEGKAKKQQKKEEKEAEEKKGGKGPSKKAMALTAIAHPPSAESLLSPEGIIMMSVAVGLDLAGLVDAIPVIGNILSYFIDFLGIILIGTWTYFRSQSFQATGKATARIGKAAKWAGRLKWLRPLLFIGELIPVVGALPLWTLLVYFELQT